MFVGRGPLTSDWFEQLKKNGRKDSIMCAYKLCRVEFRYWGMQSKCERFIYEIALRKTILRAHRQAWCWQDEYQGLTLADIRRLEDETQRELNKRMANFQTVHLSVSHAENINTNPTALPTASSLSVHDIHPTLSVKHSQQTSIDNLNANRSRINSFPVPPLPRDETPDDEYFDAECKSQLAFFNRLFSFYLAYIEGMPISRSIRSMQHAIDDRTTLSSIEDDERTYVSLSSEEGTNKCSIEFLILIFYGGM